MLERLSRRDRSALKIGGIAAALILLVKFGVFPLLDHLAGAGDRVEQKAVILQRDERLIAEGGAAEARLARAQMELKDLEAGLLASSSDSLASAEWQQLIRELADSKGIEIGSSEVVRVENLGRQYGLVVGQMSFRCRIDQLVDLLAAIATSPKLLSVRRMSIIGRQGDPKQRLDVALTIAAPLRLPQPAGNAGAQPPPR
jgi:Type II secretion system (T2SS), protein M subtype b